MTRAPLSAVLCAVLAVTGLVTLCSGGSDKETAAPTTAQITQVLAAHGAAQLKHDRTAWAAGLSTTSQSSAFVVRQRAAYANLIQLPLASWSYRIDTRTDDRGAEKTATRLYGRPAVILHLVLSYALLGFDPRPTSHDLYWTFVRQGNRAVIAGDTDLAEDGGPSWKGPWDFGPLRIATGSRALVIAHAAQASALPDIVADVDAAVPKVSAVVGRNWPQRVAVLVPSSDTELGADAGPTTKITSAVSALTVSDSTDSLSRAAIGLRLIVNPAALTTLTPLGRGIVLRHEITHIALGAVTSDASPRWLVEGMADYVGQLDIPQSVTTSAAELRVAVRAGKLPVALPTDSTFDTSSTAAQAYEQSWLACRLIAKDAGQAGLVRFYRLVGESYEPDTIIASALRQVVHESLASFTAQWRAYLRTELG